MYQSFYLLWGAFLFFCLSSCDTTTSRTNLAQVKISPSVVKSIMLYDTIQGIPLDTVLSALEKINLVIRNIDDRPAGYSLWQVQSDTIQDYRYLIQGTWPDQDSYDLIHQHPEFRKVLDNHIDVLSQTRKWKDLPRH